MSKDTLYLPWHSQALIRASQPTVIMRIGAPSDQDTEFAHIRFVDVCADPQRHSLFGDAARLLVGIGQGRPGGWTVWPPHEHGLEKEELYVYFDMAGGFGVQCLYEDLDDARCFLVREGDMVAVAGGFHPNVGCPAGRIAYVYAMAARVPGERSFAALRFQTEFGNRF